MKIEKLFQILNDIANKSDRNFVINVDVVDVKDENGTNNIKK